jgi:ribosomal protein S18 acetylase RimI-like enzyme
MTRPEEGRPRRREAPGLGTSGVFMEETVTSMDDEPFPRWGLRPVELADAPALNRYFASLSEPLSDYTFSQLFTWRNSLRILWKEIRGHLCVFANGTGDLTLLLPPIGDTGGDAALAAAFELMDDYNAAHRAPNRSRVEYVSDELLARFGRANLDVRPMGADYVYDVGRMIHLAGGDLASKRQAKNRFCRNYAYRVEGYDPARHRDECLQLLDLWKSQQDVHHALAPDADTSALKRHKESLATVLCLDSAQALGLRGLVVYVSAPGGDDGSGSLRGFTFGEPLGRDQSSITIEKTDLGVKGLPQFIFSEFCRREWAERPFVNVGDDWGLETLAWTKMSYRPVKMLKKFAVRKQPAGVVGFAAPAMPHPITAPGPVEVRAARKEDLAAAVELERICFGAGAFSLTKRQLQYLQRRPTAVFVVAEQGGAVVGQGVALLRQHRSGPSGRIYSLAVHPGRRGQRIGDSLLRAMVESLGERGVRRVYLEVDDENASAIRLYERWGFRRIGMLPDYYGPGQEAVHMVYEQHATSDVAPRRAVCK